MKNADEAIKFQKIKIRNKKLTRHAKLPYWERMDGRKSHEITVLEEFMKENGFTRKDLETQVGSRSRVSEVLSGKRQLSISMLKNLVNNWGIDANLLLKDPSNKPEKHAAPERKSGKDSIVWLLD